MGYAYGRKRTNEFLREQALKYKTRSEFAEKDGSAYSKACKMNIIDNICEHMINQTHSIPQKIVYLIFNKLLKIEGLYNTRKIIPPFELDVYYPKLNFGIEYNGELWHTNNFTHVNFFNEERHQRKMLKIKEKNINVLFIHEKCIHSFNEYYDFIKSYIIGELDFINICCNSNFTRDDVMNIEIDMDKCYKDNIDWQEVESIVHKCNSTEELYTNHLKIYRYLLRYKKYNYLLDILKNKTIENLRKKRDDASFEFYNSFIMKYKSFEEASDEDKANSKKLRIRGKLMNFYRTKRRDIRNSH